MFYDYLKSINDIVKNYNPESDNFKKMIDLNNYFINAIDKNSIHSNDVNFDNFGKIASAHTGGGKVKVVKLLSLQKSKLLKLPLQTAGGGDPIDEINALHTSVMQIIEAMPPRVNCVAGVADLEPIVLEIRRVKSVFENLINYIQYLHKLLPDETNMATLNSQLATIRQIINKY